MAFTYRETQIVKGMLARGDKQHDVAAFFGVNGGRVAEVANGTCDYPTAPIADESKLPPSGPYVSPKTVFEIREAILETIVLLREAGEDSDEAAIAVETLQDALKKLT